MPTTRGSYCVPLPSFDTRNYSDLFVRPSLPPALPATPSLVLQVQEDRVVATAQSVTSLFIEGASSLILLIDEEA